MKLFIVCLLVAITFATTTYPPYNQGRYNTANRQGHESNEYRGREQGSGDGEWMYIPRSMTNEVNRMMTSTSSYSRTSTTRRP